MPYKYKKLQAIDGIVVEVGVVVEWIPDLAIVYCLGLEGDLEVLDHHQSSSLPGYMQRAPF